MKYLIYIAIPLLLFGCEKLDNGTTTTITGLPPPTADRVVSLQWDQSQAGVVQGYKVEVSNDGSSFAELGALGPNTNAVTISGLSSKRTYFFRVRAFNQGGNSAFAPVTSVTL